MSDQIAVKFLKNEAKLLRKNNNSIKNHAESLKEIASKYGYDTWEKLLDNCHLTLPVEPIEENTLFGAISLMHPELSSYFKHLSTTIHTYLLQYDYLNTKSKYNTIFNYFETFILSRYDNLSQEYSRIYKLIDFMVTGFIEFREKHPINFHDILKFSNINKSNPFVIKNLIMSDTLVEKLKRYIDVLKIQTPQYYIYVNEIPSEANLNIKFMDNNKIFDNINLTELNWLDEDMIFFKKLNGYNLESINQWLLDYENIMSLNLLFNKKLASCSNEYLRILKTYNPELYFDYELHKYVVKHS